MAKQVVTTQSAPNSPDLLSQATIVGDLIFTAGFVHVKVDRTMVEGTVAEMFAQVILNISEVLKAAGSDLNKIVKATIYVTDIAMLPELNQAYVTYFEKPFPAREAVCVKALPLGAKIEMSVVATK